MKYEQETINKLGYMWYLLDKYLIDINKSGRIKKTDVKHGINNLSGVFFEIICDLEIQGVVNDSLRRWKND